MKLLRFIIRPFLFSTLMVLFGSGFLFSAELDDSSLFVEAFHAEQKKDYLLAIEKVNQLNQLFPDTPLRDVSLLLLARAGYKSGDNELAAKTVNRYLAEFADNPLTAGLEDELFNLALRKKNGEQLKPDTRLRTAARKTRNDRLAAELAAARRIEQERLALEQAERTRIAQAKAEAERVERERIAALKADRESISLAVSMPAEKHLFQVGKAAAVPFEIVNRGGRKEEILVSTGLSGEYAGEIRSVLNDSQAVGTITLAAGEVFRGKVLFRMPPEKVDGHKILVPVTAVSARYGDIVFKQEKLVNASAPLVRAVVKPNRSKITRSEPFIYRIALLNAGSLPAKDLKLRVTIPEQLELTARKSDSYSLESDRTVIIRVEELAAGGLAEFNLGVKAGDAAVDKMELICQVEIHNEQLKLKDVYRSSQKMEISK